MAEERQPTDIKEGASEPPAPTSTAAEDRKAAAALSSLDAQPEDEGASKKNVDSAALGAAMKKLSVDAPSADADPKKRVEKKVVKVDAADVALLVSELEVSKAKATEMLRAHDGDAVKTMVAFVTATV